MKKVIKTMLAFAALMLCGGAWAVGLEQAAVYWDRDFETTTKNGFTIGLNGNTVENGHIKIGNQGFYVEIPSGHRNSAYSFLVKYSNFSAKDKKSVALFAATDSANNYGVGVYVDADRNCSTSFKVASTGTTTATFQTTYPAIAVGSGFYQMAVNGNSNVYFWSRDAIQSGTDNTGKFATMGTGASVQRIYIGGPVVAPSGDDDPIAMTDMYIEGVALFENKYWAINSNNTSSFPFANACAAGTRFTTVSSEEVDAATLTWVDASGDSAAAPTTSDKVVIYGSGDVTIKNAKNLNFVSIAASPSCNLTLEYDCTTATLDTVQSLRDSIKTAGSNITYLFKGANTFGASLPFATNLTNTFRCHLVFDGGTHTISVGQTQNSALASGNTPEAPFIHVKQGTLLSLKSAYLSGWNVAVQNDCIIRVDNGATLKSTQASARMWYTGQLYLEPGATVDLSGCDQVTNGIDKFGFCGGVNASKCQIYVPATPANQEMGVVKILNRPIALCNDGTKGAGIFVGENSRLELEGVTSDSTTPTFTKYGAGQLLIKGGTYQCGTSTISAGFIGVNSTPIANGLTINSGASIIFPANHAADTPYTLCNGTLTVNGATDGVVANVEAYVGATAKLVNLTYDTDAKTVKYTLVRDAGTVYLRKDGKYYTDDTAGSSTQTTLIEGDVIIVGASHGDIWQAALPESVLGHTVKFTQEMNLKGEGVRPGLTVINESTAGVYIEKIGTGARISGTGVFSAGYTGGNGYLTIGDDVEIGCQLTIPSTAYALIIGKAKITGTINNQGSFKLAEGGSLKVASGTNVGTITSNVAGKYVCRVTSDGMTTYSLGEAVATVTSGSTTTSYATLEQALEAVSSEEDIVALVKDVVLNQKLVFPTSFAGIINFNGHVISGAVEGYLIKVPSTATVVLGDSVGNGGVSNTAQNGMAIENWGSLQIYGGNFTGRVDTMSSVDLGYGITFIDNSFTGSINAYLNWTEGTASSPIIVTSAPEPSGVTIDLKKTGTGDNYSYSFTAAGTMALRQDGFYNYKANISATILIPSIDNTTRVVTVNGVETEVVQNAYIQTAPGAMVVVTYTPVAGYLGGGSVQIAAGSESLVTSSIVVSPAKAKIGENWYDTLSAALDEATSGQTVTLLAECSESVTIPGNVTVETTGTNKITGTVSGSGKLVLIGNGFNSTQSANIPVPSGVMDSSNWTGTVEIRDWYSHGDANNLLVPSKFGNQNSTLIINGYKGYVHYKNAANQDSGVNTLKALEISGDGILMDGSYSGTHQIKIKAETISGNGPIVCSIGGGNAANFYLIGDASAYTGSVTADSNYRVVFAGAENDTLPNHQNGSIAIGSTAKVMLGNTSTWTANGGIKIAGTIGGSGTLASATTFSDGATIDLSEGTLTANGTVAFGASINLAGEVSDDDSIIKGLAQEPANLSFTSVTVAGSAVDGARLYFEGGAVKYTIQAVAAWTPNTDALLEGDILDWTAPDAWMNGSTSATWPTDQDAAEALNVSIDATTVKGVKITGQVYVNEVVVSGALGDDESFQFHNHLMTVNNEHEVNPEGEGHDCLHTAGVNLTGLEGELGLKVPITGNIAFGSETDLVFATGTGDTSSTAYGYTFIDRGGSITVEGTGKFLVPSTMYAIPFEVASGAKLVYSQAGEVTGEISGAGSVLKDGNTTITFNAVNTFTGGTIVEAGTLKLGTARCLGAQGAAVTVNPNGILDVGGVQNHGIVLTLAGGTLKNSVGNVSTSNVQFRSISLSADSVIDIDYSTGIVNNSHNATTLQLNNHKLIKKGDGIFLITRVTVSNGTIEIQAGQIKVEQGYNCNFTNVVFTVPSTAGADIVIQNASSTTAGNGTIFKQATRTGGETIYAVNETPSYVLGSGNSATLKNNDVVVFDSDHYTGDQWGSSVGDLTSHTVTVNMSMNWNSNYEGTMTIGSSAVVYLYGDGIGSQLGNGANLSGGTVNLNGSIEVTGAVSVTSTIAGSGTFKLTTEQTTLVVSAEIAGKVVSGVDGYVVKYDSATKTYSLQRVETLQTWSAGTIIFDGDLHKLTANDDGTYTKTIKGVEYTINLHGHQLVTEGDRSYILIKEGANSDQIGVTVSHNATDATGLTMVMKYSDLGYKKGSSRPIPFTINSNHSSFPNNIVSPYIASEDGTVKVGWGDFYNNTEWESSSSGKFDASVNSGSLALTYGTSGTRVFQKTEDSWTEIFNNGSVMGSGTYNVNGVAVGGLYNAHQRNGTLGNTAVVAAGMKIYSLAVSTTPINSSTEDSLVKMAFEGDDLIYSSFLTGTAVETGWYVRSLDDLLDYSYIGTMDGSSITGSNVDARGFHLTKDGDSVIFQMQVRQNGGSDNDHVKAVKVKMTLDANNQVRIKGESAGHVSNVYLGTDVTSWNDTLATTASASDYGVNKIIATKNPAPYVSVGFNGDTWSSSSVMNDYAGGRTSGNYMNERGTSTASDFVSVRGSSDNKAVRIADGIRPSYKNDPNVTFTKAIQNGESWTVQIVAKMIEQTGKRLCLWGVGETSYEGSGDRGVVLFLNADGRPQFCKYGNQSTTDLAVATEGESLYDKRYHVYTVVCDASAESDKYIVYVDGVKVASSESAALAPLPTSNSYFEIGTVRGNVTELPNGVVPVESCIDDIAAWNVALSAERVALMAMKFPVWPTFDSLDWHGEDGADIKDFANWGDGSEFDTEEANGVFPEGTKTVTLSSETSFGSLEINGTYTFTGNGTVNVTQLMFGSSGTLRLEDGATIHFVGAMDSGIISKITFAGGKVTTVEVPRFTSSDTINVADVSELAAGAYDLITWTGILPTGDAGYGKPQTNIQNVQQGWEGKLVFQATKISLLLRDPEWLARKPLTIWPFGDSITEGFNNSNKANYRIQLFQKLELLGYNVKSVGWWTSNHDGQYSGCQSYDPTGTICQREDWSYHSGVRSARVMWENGSNNVLCDAVETGLDQAGDPDVVLLHIGTNDGASGATWQQVYDGITNVAWRIVAARENTKVVMSTILPLADNRDLNTTHIAKINQALKDAIDAKVFPEGRVYLADLWSYVPTMGNGHSPVQNYVSDDTHPDWIGHDKMANGWLDTLTQIFTNKEDPRIQSNIVRTAPTADHQGAAANVPAEYRKGYRKLATFKPTSEQHFALNESVYTTTESGVSGETTLSNVAYYMELINRETKIHRFVWVDMAAFDGATFSACGFPTAGNHQAVVRNLHVYANTGAIENVDPSDNTKTGFIEFSPFNYGSGKGTTEGAPNNSHGYDWSDTLQTGSSSGYGCFQVHRISPSAPRVTAQPAQVLFAYNKWGDANSGVTEIGIGNFSQYSPSNLDYTGTAGHKNIDASAYEVINIEFWGKVPGCVVPDGSEVEVAEAETEQAAIEGLTIATLSEADAAANAGAGNTNGQAQFLTLKATPVAGESGKWMVQAVVDNEKLPENKKINDTAVAFAQQGLEAVAGATETTHVDIPAASVTPGLYYSVSFGTTPDNHTQESERILATGSEGVTIPVPALGNEKVYYIKVKASATK